jgi:hypothetical protein
MIKLLFWCMISIPEGPPFLVYKNKEKGYKLEDVKDRQLRFYRMPLFLYVTFFVLPFLVYYWGTQLENDTVEVTTTEWEISMVIFLFLIKQISRAYLRIQQYNKTVEVKKKLKFKGLLAILFVINYIFVSVFGLYHSFTDHQPVFAWAIFSCYLILLFVVIQINDFHYILN